MQRIRAYIINKCFCYFNDEQEKELNNIFLLLRVLDGHCCHNVTDGGIEGLGVSVDAGLGKCKSLHTLNIYGTKITTKGVQMAL